MFALQRLGCEVWPVHTVQFSNHTGYGTWKGEVFAAARIGEVIDGIADIGVLGACDGVLSGYIGAVETGEAIVAAVGKVKAANPTLGYRSEYGTDSGPWTTDMFVEVVYNELAAKKGKK